jgi:hypothetical protein
LALDPRLSTKCRSQAPAQTILESGTDSGRYMSAGALECKAKAYVQKVERLSEK